SNWNSLNFNGSIGPGGGGANITAWPFTDMSFSATHFIVPLGVPVVSGAAATWDALAIGTGAGQFHPDKFHGDRFSIYTDGSNGSPSARGALTGRWSSTGFGGRFYHDLCEATTLSYKAVGFRCLLLAE